MDTTDNPVEPEMGATPNWAETDDPDKLLELLESAAPDEAAAPAAHLADLLGTALDQEDL